jgi:hypothetical protein
MVATALPEPSQLQFHCDHCLAELCVPIAFCGVTAPCPHCGGIITAPSADFLIAPIPQRPLKPIPVHLEPPPKRKREQKRIRLQENGEPEPTEPAKTASKPKREWKGVAMFEKRGFRLVRMALTIASAAVLFGSFQALKSRRWIWQHPTADIAQIVSAPQSQPQTGDGENAQIALPPLPGIDRVLPK